MKELILAIAALIGRGTPSPAIVDAIAGAVETPEEAATMTLYAAYESAYRDNVRGDAGRSCGVWQQQCARVGSLSLGERARVWIYDVRHFGLAAVDSSARRATRRQSKATELLDRVTLPEE
jgi:hypothetical protein